MAIMKIGVSRLDTEGINDVGKLVTSLMLLSNEKGIKCKLTLTSNGLMVEGNQETLLEVLEELDDTSFKLIEFRSP